MRSRLCRGILSFAIAITAPTLASAQSLCTPLLEFVQAVNLGESREFILHTSWGSGFKDSNKELVFSAKRCVHYNYDPAVKVCDYLLENAAVEFSGNNVKRVITCLSPETKFAPLFGLHRGSFSFRVGTGDRGSNVDIEFHEDLEIGGMALKVSADGY